MAASRFCCCSNKALLQLQQCYHSHALYCWCVCYECLLWEERRKRVGRQEQGGRGGRREERGGRREERGWRREEEEEGGERSEEEGGRKRREE